MKRIRTENFQKKIMKPKDGEYLHVYVESDDVYIVNLTVRVEYFLISNLPLANPGQPNLWPTQKIWAFQERLGTGQPLANPRPTLGQP